MRLQAQAVCWWTFCRMMIRCYCPLFKVWQKIVPRSLEKWWFLAFGPVEIKSKTREGTMQSGWVAQTRGAWNAWCATRSCSWRVLTTKSSSLKELPPCATLSCIHWPSPPLKDTWPWDRLPWTNGPSNLHVWKRILMRQWTSTTRNSTHPASPTKPMGRNELHLAIVARMMVKREFPSQMVAPSTRWSRWPRQKAKLTVANPSCPTFNWCSPARVACTCTPLMTESFLRRGPCVRSTEFHSGEAEIQKANKRKATLHTWKLTALDQLAVWGHPAEWDPPFKVGLATFREFMSFLADHNVVTFSLVCHDVTLEPGNENISPNEECAFEPKKLPPKAVAEVGNCGSLVAWSSIDWEKGESQNGMLKMYYKMMYEDSSQGKGIFPTKPVWILSDAREVVKGKCYQVIPPPGQSWDCKCRASSWPADFGLHLREPLCDEKRGLTDCSVRSEIER